MPNLNFEQFAELAKVYNLIPLHADLPADLDTPVSAFLKIRSGDFDFLFESVEGGEKWGRYSFLGTRPKKVYTLIGGKLSVFDLRTRIAEDLACGDSPLDAFRDILEDIRPYEDPSLPRFFGGLVGYFSYGMVRHFDKIRITSGADVPDLCLMQTDTVVVFDNLGQVMKILCPVWVPREARFELETLKNLYGEALTRIEALKQTLQKPLSVTDTDAVPAAQGEVRVTESMTRDEYCRIVEQAREYIKAGDIFQVVLSNRFTVDAPHVDPFRVYRRLRRLNPSPYMYYLKIREHTIVGSSPEILVRLEDEKITLRPIAGTRRRGRTEDEDRALEAELLKDPKELAEHIMLVDLGRNDAGRVALTGSVRVEQQNTVERYSHVMHIVSQVTGQLAPGKDVFDVIAAAFPAGTLSGAPKIRAMEIIDELGGRARGLYGGAVGYVSYTGNADLAIAIRTAVFQKGQAIVQAGAGIVYNSVPESEYQECVNKAAAVIQAIKG